MGSNFFKKGIIFMKKIMKKWYAITKFFNGNTYFLNVFAESSQQASSVATRYVMEINDCIDLEFDMNQRYEVMNASDTFDWQKDSIYHRVNLYVCEDED